MKRGVNTHAKAIFPPFIILLLLICTTSYAEQNKIADTIHGYFEALKKGDTVSVKDHLMGKFYERNRVLLEENVEYPNFLRRHYNKSELQIINIVCPNESGVMLVEVEILFPDGSSDHFTLHLQKDDQQNWRIFRETCGDK